MCDAAVCDNGKELRLRIERFSHTKFIALSMPGKLVIPAAVQQQLPPPPLPSPLLLLLLLLLLLQFYWIHPRSFPSLVLCLPLLKQHFSPCLTETTHLFRLRTYGTAAVIALTRFHFISFSKSLKTGF